MATRKRTVEIDVVADTSKATRELKDVGDSAETTEKKFGGMGKGVAGAFAAIAATQVVGFLRDAAVAAAEDQRAQADLALALQNTVKATDDQIFAVEEYITKTSLATGVSDDELRPALESLTRATGDLDEAQSLLAIAMDIAAATGKPLQTVIDAMGKAINNNSIGALGRLGLKVKDASGEFLTFDEVMQEAQRTMGGAMETAASTGAGSMARLQVAISEAMEEIGTVALPLVVEAADEIIEELNNIRTAGDQSFFDEVLGDIAAFGDIANDPHAKPLIDSFKSLAEMVGIDTTPAVSEMYDVLSSAPLSVDPATGAVEGLADGMDDLTGDTDEAKTALQEFEDEVRSQTDPMYALVKANDDVAAAEADVIAKHDEFAGQGPEYEAALLTLAQKNDALTIAQLKVAEQSDLTRAEFETHLRSMGNISNEQIDIILAAFARAEAFKFSEKLLELRPILRGTGPARRAVEDQIGNALPGQHQGGVVPGDFPGQEVQILARAGEKFGSAAPANGHGGDGVAVIQFNVDGRTLFEQAVLPELVRYRKRNGSI